MAESNVFTKDPSATLDYQWDWSRWLHAGESIIDATIGVPTDLAITQPVTIEDKKVTARLSGGTAQEKYIVSCTIETDQGRIDTRRIYIHCARR